MGIYNRQLTGHALRLPHLHYHSIYNPEPLSFLGAEAVTPRELAPDWHPERRSTTASVKVHIVDLAGSWVLFTGRALTPVLLLLPLVLRRRWQRFALLLILLVAGSTLLSLFSPPHYVAPITCLVVLLLMQCLRTLLAMRWRGRRIGRLIAVCLLLLCAVEHVVDAVRGSYFNQRDRLGARAELVARLERSGGRHLVLVQYGPEHNTHQEWVYNSARIDDQTVIFARSLDEPSNRALIDYFKGREIWSLRIDDDRAVPDPVRLPG